MLIDFKVEGDWGCIWCLKALPEFKNFIWRMCRGLLPDKMRFMA